MPEPIERAIGALRAVSDNLEQLDATMRDRTEHFKRILYAIAVCTLTGTLTMLVVLSAVMPGFPFLRIYERNNARTAEVITGLTCTELWANDKRVPGCEKVNAILDARAKAGQ